MEMKLDIPFQQLLKMIRQLNTIQLKKVQEVLSKSEGAMNGPSNDIDSLLLNGPVFSKEQLKSLKGTRLAFEKWRAE